MDMYSNKSKSIPQKVLILVLEIAILAISYWVLFKGGYQFFFGDDVTIGNSTRHQVILIFNIVLFLRINLTMFYLVKRAIPWEEAFSIPFAFALYYVGFAMFAYSSLQPLDYLDVFAMILFGYGSQLNTFSELRRHLWKKRPENKGKLYTEGGFKYAMHINYFGDLLWVIAYAIITRNWYAVSIVIFLFCFFAFYNIPKLDEYLASKYGEEFEAYKKKTKKFIPFIY